MKEKLAQKMLEEKLDFLSLKDSLALHNSEPRVQTRFWWVARTEEIGDKAFNMSSEEIIAEVYEIYGEGNDYALTIGCNHNHFQEFTYALCPAPTYIDLIKALKETSEKWATDIINSEYKQNYENN
jgi:hypothetical protein